MFDNFFFDNYEGVYFFSDEVSGFWVVIVIYLMVFGLLLGGICMWDYLDSKLMVMDVL